MSVRIPDFRPDLSELAPVHEGSIATVRLRTTSRAARLCSWHVSRIQPRQWGVRQAVWTTPTRMRATAERESLSGDASVAPVAIPSA
jgi:hypothetical protein